MPVSAEATASLPQALLAIRFPVAPLAPAFWTLQDFCLVRCRFPQMLFQTVTGHNLLAVRGPATGHSPDLKTSRAYLLLLLFRSFPRLCLFG